MPTPISAGRPFSASAPEGAPGASYPGRVDAVQTDAAGKKVAVIDFALGRLRAEVPDDVQAGDVLKLTVTANGWRVEKPADPAEDPADPGPDVGMPANWPALLRDLSRFENALSGFLAAAATGTAAPPAMQSLPVLLRQVLSQPDGLEFLTQQIGQLPSATLKTLIGALAQLPAPADQAGQRELLTLLQGFRRALGTSSNMDDTNEKVAVSGATTLPSSGAASNPAAADAIPTPPSLNTGKELPRYLVPATGSALFTGHGLVLESRSAALPGPAGRRAESGPEASDPTRLQQPSLTRYRLDLGGASLEAVSTETRAPGDFVRFSLQRESGNLVMRFQSPERSWPPALQTALTAADPPRQSALRLAADFLEPDLNQPGGAQAVLDLAHVLADSGRLQGGQPLPAQDEMNFLLRLVLAFPRDATAPQTQAWSNAGRNPAAFTDFLEQVRPDADAALLTRDLPLRAAVASETDPTAAAHSSWSQALADLGRTDARLDDLLDALRNAAPDGGKLDAAGKYWLQTVTGSTPRPEAATPGEAQTYYFFDNAWHPAGVQWSQVGAAPQRGRPPAERPPVQLQIRTQTPHLGEVEIKLSLDRRGSHLDFRNNRGDVRELLSQSLAPLEHLLSDLEMRLSGWSYAPLPEKSQAQAAETGDGMWPKASGPMSQVDLLG